MNLPEGNKETEMMSQNSCIIECFVFREQKCIGWDCFHKKSFSIGRSKKADLVLADENISDIEAFFYSKGDQIKIICDKNGNNGVRVNGKEVSTYILKPLDIVSIGPYTLKIKLQKISGQTPDIDAPAFDRSQRSTASKIDPLVTEIEEIGYSIKTKPIHETPKTSTSNRTLIVDRKSLGNSKRDEVAEAIVRTKEIAPFRIEKDDGEDRAEKGEDDETILLMKKTESFTTEKDSGQDISQKRGGPETETPPKKTKVFAVEEDEDDEEEEENLNLFLKDRLLGVKPPKSAYVDDIALEVVKFKNENIFDVRFLKRKEKFFIANEKSRFCIAENKDNQNCFFFFDDRIQGELRSNDASNIDITDLRTSENLHRKRKNIYRLLLPKKGNVVLSDGFYDYLLRKVVRTPSPHIAEPPKERNPFYKNLMKSAGFHVFMMVLLGIFISFPEMPRTQEPESRFVKIDTSRFKKKKPTPPPKRKPKPKPKKVKARTIQKQTPPKPPKKKVVVTAKKPKRKTKPILKKARKPQRVALKNKGISKPSPKAGVGTGKKRNVSNRNVNQAGILGIIGDTIGFKPKEALAAITNLDTVSFPADTRNFKVGGIVGKLDIPKIEIPSGAIVKTKGSAQVLRSAGVKGEGRVAALKEGKTGQKRVMAMVSVELDKTVRIRGGMSREQVKRIIDQHLHEISLCYENSLMNDPSLIGRIVFEWRVLGSGRVGEVNIKSSSVKSNQLHSCIKRAIKSWQFPRPKNTEVVVSYPFVFDSVGF